MNATDLPLVPQPKEITFGKRSWKPPADGYVVLTGEHPAGLLGAAERLKQAAPGSWQITAGTAGDPARNAATLVCNPDLDVPEQGYVLEVTPEGATIEATTPAGVYYGVCTLCQLLTDCRDRVPQLSIKDWPDFPARGVMLDISRDKVPTLETLTTLVDMLAGWKINQLQLYTEHTFAYRAHKVVWKDASPLTGEEILALDRFCAERFVELVPNQNSFGHMERWLKHDDYKHLAESSEGFSLCPSDPGSIQLIGSLYDELLPHFSSKLFNVGCDETFDLGKGRSKELCEKVGVGRVYLDFLLKVHEQVMKHDRKMLFWGDIILHHPELISELPKDVVALEWGYEANHPFADHGSKFASAGVEFWVCPGTSSWNSIAGRTDNCLANLRGAAVNGLEQGATGFLNTDWGDNGHWQYLPVSYLGFLHGAGVSWNSKDDQAGTLKSLLSRHAFLDMADVMGPVAYDLGNVYSLLARKAGNASVLFGQLSRPLADLSVVEGISREDLAGAEAATQEVAERLGDARMARPDAELIKDEFANAASMIVLACRMGMMRLDLAEDRDISGKRADAKRQLTQIIAEHRRLWLARNRPGGLVDSTRKLDARLSDLLD